MAFLEVVGLLALIGLGLFLFYYWGIIWVVSYFFYDQSVEATKKNLDDSMKDWNVEQKRMGGYYEDS